MYHPTRMLVSQEALSKQIMCTFNNQDFIKHKNMHDHKALQKTFQGKNKVQKNQQKKIERRKSKYKNNTGGGENKKLSEDS